MTSAPSGSDDSTADRLLASLQADFLDELGERIDRLEDLTLAFERGGFGQAGFDALYRSVHSLKGAAGSFGFSILSAVCHAYEDYLNAGKQADPQFINHCLAYVDLLRQTCGQILDRQHDFDRIEARIRQLREQHFAKAFTAMLVEPSITYSQFCRQALARLPVQVVQMDDGLQALTRLLSEPFDLLITSQEIKTLNGLALISAIQLASKPGQAVKTILLTSQTADLPANTNVGPDCIVRKDRLLGQHLAKAVSQALDLTT